MSNINIVKGVAVSAGLLANLPQTASAIATALGIPASNVVPGFLFFTKDTGTLWVWNGTAMVQTGVGAGSVTIADLLSVEGTGSKVQLTNAGMTTSGDVVTYDGNGNVQDSGTLLSSLATSSAVTSAVATETTRAEAAEATLTANVATNTANIATNATAIAGKVSTSTTVNGHALSANVTVSASDITTGTLPHGQLPALVSGDIPNNAANTTGTSGGLSGTPSITVSTVSATTFSGNPTFSGTPSFSTMPTFPSVTGTGAMVFATSPSFVTPALGTPASGNLANCTFPTLNQNTTGTAANLSGTPALPNGTTATTQTAGDNSTKLATTGFVSTAVGAITVPVTSVFGRTGAVVAASNDYSFSQISGSATVAQLPTTGTWAFAGTMSGNVTYTGNDISSNTTAATGSSGPAVVASQFISAAGTGVQANGSSITTTGATLLVAVMSIFAPANTSGGLPTIADGLGNTWNYTPTVYSWGSQNMAVRVAYAYSNAGSALSTGSDSFTVAINGAGSWTAAIYAFSGTLTTSAVYDSAVGIGHNSGVIQVSPFIVGTITPSPGDIVISNITNGQSYYTATSINQGFGNILNGVTNGASAACLLGATGQTLTPTWTYTGGGASFGQLVCFKSAGTTVATSPQSQWAGTYYTGSASASDTWTMQSKPGAGNNSISTLAVTHSGAPGSAIVQVPGLAVQDPTGNVVNFTNTTAATAAGVNQNSPALSLNGTYFTNGASAQDSWIIQNQIAASLTSATLTNVVETSGSIVTLTITGGSFSSGVTGTPVTFSNLTTATWLNGVTVYLTSASSTNLIFVDPTGHGTQASAAETGIVTQVNPTSTLALTHMGSAVSQIQVPVPNIKTSVPTPTIVCEGATQTGISVSNAAANPLYIYCSGSAAPITCYNSGNLVGQINSQVSAADFIFTGLGSTTGIGTSAMSATNTYPCVSMGMGSQASWASTTSGSNLMGVNIGTKINQVGDSSLWLSWAPPYGSSNFQAVSVSPTINQAGISNTVVGSALVSNVAAVVFSTLNAYTVSNALAQVNVGTNTALNGTQTLSSFANRAASPYTITNSVETSASVVTLTIGTHSIVANDWITVTGLTTATWLNGQTVKVTSVVANTSVTFTDLTTHGTSASHSDTGSVYCSYVTFTLTHANITGSADTGTVLEQSTGTYTGILINPTETATNTNQHMLIDCQVGSTRKWGITNKGHEVTGTANNDGSGVITSSSGTTVSYTFANAYNSTPVVVVTPTTNSGAFYLSSVSTTGFTVTYATSGAASFNYMCTGNPS